MKFISTHLHSTLRSGLAAATSLALALGTIACSRDYTADYVYSISSSNGTISGFAVDYQSGVLTQLSGSPYATNLTNPSTLVAAPNGKTVYAIGGTQQSQVVALSVGTDGKLYAQKSYNLAANGTYPTAATIDTAGAYLYVTYTYQNGFTPASPGPGGVSVFKIASDGTLGTPFNVNVGNNPVAITVAPPTCTATPANGLTGNATCTISGSSASGVQNIFVYVVDQETATTPSVLGFAQNTSTGALTTLSGTTCTTTTPNTCTGYRSGISPSAIAVEPTGRFLYVSDKTSNQILGYQIASTSTGNLTPLVSSPFGTGLYPVALTIDPRGKYLYAANFNSATVSSYSINAADGALGGTAAAGSFTTQARPNCITIDPALGIYLYTSNFLAGSISGGQLSPNTGQLNSVPTSYFTVGPLPSCVVSVANGAHAVQVVYP